MQDIEEVHRAAIRNDEETYIDPVTGLTVFTEVFHLRRGNCCGSQCRHCPYNDWSTGKPIRKTKSADQPVNGINNNNNNKNNSNSDDEMFFDSQEQFRSSATNSNGTDTSINKAAITATATATATTATSTSKPKLHVPYTRTGDKGTSQLLTGERRSKTDPVFEALGTVDELCAVVGVAHALLMSPSTGFSSSSSSLPDTPQEAMQQHSFPKLDDQLVQIMSRLFDVGSHVAKPKRIVSDEEDSSSGDDGGGDGGGDKSRFAADGIGGGFDLNHVKELEAWIDEMTAELPLQRSFILPSGTVASAQFHVARCVCRRAERSVVDLVLSGVCDPNSMKYLNRLSDYLFTAARWINMKQGGDEIAYMRPFRGATQRVATKVEKKK